MFLKIYSCSTFLGSFPVPHKISVAVKTYNRSPPEVDTGESEAQAHLQLHKKFKVSLGYETLSFFFKALKKDKYYIPHSYVNTENVDLAEEIESSYQKHAQSVGRGILRGWVIVSKLH